MRNRIFYTLLAASACLNVFLILPRLAPPTPAKAESLDPETYPFLAQRVLVDARNDALINFAPLRRDLQAYAKGAPRHLGVFFQYLPTGISIGINEDEPFIAASLLKLPTVMKVYKMIEDGKVSRNNMLQLNPAVMDTFYGSLWRRGPGAKVTVEEALALSLAESDNTAHRLLYSLSLGRPSDIFDYLDVNLESVEGETAVSPRTYTTILRSLYFAAYLNLKHSNEILAHLTRAAEGHALLASLPDDIPVAQKFGIRVEASHEFPVYTNCGIFYVPSRPYTLCVMLGAERETAERHISEISQLVYDFVSTR